MTNVQRPTFLHLPTNSPIGSSPKTLSPSASPDLLPSQILPHLFVGNQGQTNRETLNRLNISYILSLGLLPLIGSSVSPTSPTGQQKQKQQQQQHQQQHQQQQQKVKPNNHHHSQHQISMPSRNSSKDFKIRIRTNATTSSTPQTPTIQVGGLQNNTPLIGGGNNNSMYNSIAAAAATATAQQATLSKAAAAAAAATTTTRDENKGIKPIRWIQCRCINIADNSETTLSKFFDEAHQFIDEARRRKCNILVHCQAGISRSPTFAIAYLMRLNSLPLQDAYDLVRKCRPQTEPNLSFICQLMLYEKSLELGSSTSSAQTPTTKSQQQQQQQQQPQATTNTNTTPTNTNSQHKQNKHQRKSVTKASDTKLLL